MRFKPTKPRPGSKRHGPRPPGERQPHACLQGKSILLQRIVEVALTWEPDPTPGSTTWSAHVPAERRYGSLQGVATMEITQVLDAREGRSAEAIQLRLLTDNGLLLLTLHSDRMDSTKGADLLRTLWRQTTNRVIRREDPHA